MELLLTPPLPSVRHLYEIDDQRGEEYSNAAWMKHRSSPLSSPVVFVKPPPLSALQHRRHGVALIMLGSASCCSYLLPLFSGQPLSPGIRHDLKLLPLYVLSSPGVSVGQHPGESHFQPCNVVIPCQDCSPVAETVVTTVSGMKYDIKRLSDALSRHDEVVLEIRDAIRELAADKPFMCNARPPAPDDVVHLGSLLSMKVERIPQVLNVVVRMLTTTSERQRWFLPTSIMQAAIDDRSMTFGNMTSLHNKYMRSKVDRVTRIYQPMWCDRHWYLMIIDVPRKKLIYLDSLRDPHQADARKTGMMRVALYLEGLTLGKPWLSGEGALRPRFSAFDFEEPDVPQQKGNSMDCGVWVAQWMIREHLWKDYGVQHVNSATRMRLAADLVLKSHNEIAQEVVAKAFAHWEMKST
ncbi:hypothetical protein Ahy_B03g067029 isoform F [Arachis hypogaea]|uniref:Ubiquitin-like protease family profile domain-containing protein n=1 Tax=Arachis hypogaea TaxID=3818 RepID=A0A445A5M5_ARAHY|nr:hypothetical protein Ahy_B03g067029 isoform F [Arachis hypogaea]